VDVNQCTLTGTVQREPRVTFTDAGTQQVSFTLACTETNPAGQAFTLFVPVECYGQVASVAESLSAGDPVLVSGKLKWTSYVTKNGAKKANLCVLARLVTLLGVRTPASVSYDTPQHQEA
jgi:single-stranded DNA-binding protein